MTKRDDIIEGSKAGASKYGVVYTCRCGWIDVGHGTASSKRPFVGADKLWAQISGETGTPSPNGLWHQVRYRQDFSRKVFGVAIGDNVTRDYAVRRGLSMAEKEAVALSIFMQVSVEFETLQGTGLWSLSNSSFSGEDLVSNLVGFYRVVRPGVDYLTLCQPVSKKAAQAVWDRYGAPGDTRNKNHSFGPHLYPCSDCKGGPGGPVCAPLPPELSVIQPIPIGALYRSWNPAEPEQATKPAAPPSAPQPAPDPARPAPAPERTIPVKRGDTLSGLAAAEYRDWRYWPLLWQANRSAVGSNPNLLKRGIVLRIPPFDSFTVQQKADAVRFAPQWKIFPH